MKTLKQIIFWILSLTWGLPMTLVGAFVALYCLIRGRKPKHFYQNVYFVFPSGGWGFNCGPFFFLTADAEHLNMKQHECGHGIQNIIFGPFMPFIVSIPSAIRFYYREWLVSTGKKKCSDLSPYDSAWFEGMATKLGEKFYK